MNHRRPPRIEGFDYQGPSIYFLTVCTFRRRRWFDREDCATEAIAELLRTSKDYGFAVLTYCLMPDHLHCLVEGLRADSNCVRWIAMFKQRSAFRHARSHRERLWQEGYFERVLRPDDDCIGIAAYIIANPIRAGLCHAVADYPHIGSDCYTIEQLTEAIQMRPAWK